MIPNAFGLDISDRSMKAIWLKKEYGGLDLASWGEHDIPEGLIREGEIQDIAGVAALLRETLQRAQGRRIATPYVALSLPEEKSFLRMIQMPRLKEKELQSAVLFEAENYIPFPLTEVALEFQIIPPLKDDLDHFDILLAAIPNSVVASYTETIKQNGLTPVLMEPESMAIGRALIRGGASSETTLLIDFGASRTTFIVFVGYSVRFTYSIAASGAELTRAISDSFHVSVEEAEKLKITHGLSREFEGGKMIEAMKPVLEELVEDIKKQMDFYEEHTAHEHLADGKSISKLLLSGGGSLLTGFDGFLAERLRVDIDFANPWVNIFGSRHAQIPALPFRKSLAYTTALGLSLAGQDLFGL